MDFYTEIDIIAGKSYAKPFGATTTTTLWLYHSTQRKVVADS